MSNANDLPEREESTDPATKQGESARTGRTNGLTDDDQRTHKDDPNRVIANSGTDSLQTADMDLFPDHPQTHCEHGTWFKEDICLSCQQEWEQRIRDDERDKIAAWLDKSRMRRDYKSTIKAQLADRVRNNEHRGEA